MIEEDTDSRFKGFIDSAKGLFVIKSFFYLSIE